MCDTYENADFCHAGKQLDVSEDASHCQQRRDGITTCKVPEQEFQVTMAKHYQCIKLKDHTQSPEYKYVRKQFKQSDLFNIFRYMYRNSDYTTENVVVMKLILDFIDPIFLHQRHGSVLSVIVRAVDDINLDILYHAIRRGMMLNNFETANSDPFHLLCKFGVKTENTLAAAQILLKAGADPTIPNVKTFSYKNMTALQIAEYRNWGAMVSLIKEHTQKNCQ
jgi:hypothetical protein